MKPPPFEYFAPDTLEEALGLLAAHGYDAKPLAGGQSLIPMLNFRLACPAVLVDLNRIASLGGIDPAEDGGLRIGAMARQRDVERSPQVAERAPLLAETMPHVAHPQIRNRGTVGGSAAHADPAAELPAVLLNLEARFHIQGPNGKRVVPASDFFAGLFTTALAPEELLVAVEIPPPSPGSGWAFEEVARRHGDYALVGVAAGVRVGEDGRCLKACLSYVNAGSGPVAVSSGAGPAGAPVELLVGATGDPEIIQQVSEAAAAELDPPEDIHASPAFRRHLAKVLTERALRRAFQEATRSLEEG